MNRQDGSSPWELLCSGVNDDVLVVLCERYADAGVRVDSAHDREIVSVDPKGQGRCQGIVEWRLTPLLLPQRVLIAALNGQAPSVGQMLDIRIVEHFVWRLKERVNDAIYNGQAHEQADDGPGNEMVSR